MAHFLKRHIFFLTAMLASECFINQANGLNVPGRELGFIYKTCDTCKPQITLSLYCDSTCSDCKRAFPNVVQAADHFGPHKVKLVTHLFSLPYHRHSHTVAKGAHVIDAFTSGISTYKWFQIIYDNLGSLTTSATANLTDVEVLDKLAELAENVSGIQRDHFIDQVTEMLAQLITVSENEIIRHPRDVQWLYIRTKERSKIIETRLPVS